MLRLEGPHVERLVSTEPGGHRFQRVPPNEKRGRVHTSTVTIAAFLETSDAHARTRPIASKDVVVETYRGSGPGGQHRNKTESCARALHVPTGIEAKSESERSQHQNITYALASLAARVAAHERARVADARARERKAQVGSGQRGDKVRTIRMQDDVVTDERSGTRMRARDYLRGVLPWLDD